MNDPQKYKLLDIFSKIIHVIRGPHVLDCASKIILHAFVNKRLNQPFDLMIRNMTQTICAKLAGKIDTGRDIGKNVFMLVDYLLQNEMVSWQNRGKFEAQRRIWADKPGYSGFDANVYKSEDEKHFKMHQKAAEASFGASKSAKKPQMLVNFNFRDDYSLSENENFLLKALEENLKILLQVNDCHQNYTKKLMGYALLDLQGNFIWADKATCNLLDVKLSVFRKQNVQRVNLFEKMIPPSLDYLRLKFGDQVLDGLNEAGQSISFSYVIYSRISMEKYLKNLKSCSLFDHRKIHLSKPNERQNEIFYRYLKSVSSRATLVRLSYSNKDLQNILYYDTSQLDISKPMIQRMLDLAGCEIEEGDGSRSKYFVFLETRRSQSIPKFDYEALRKEAIICGFEETLQKSLKRKEEKKRRKGGKVAKGKKIRKMGKNNRKIKKKGAKRQLESVEEKVGKLGKFNKKGDFFAGRKRWKCQFEIGFLSAIFEE